MSAPQQGQGAGGGGNYAGQPITSPAAPAAASTTTTGATGGAMSNQNLNQIVSVIFFMATRLHTHAHRPQQAT